MPYIEHPLGKTWYIKRGVRKRNIPLIALHGGPGSAHHAMQAYLKLSHSRQVFLYDQIGCGRSSLSGKKHWTIATFVRELDYLLKAWDITRYHLLGASWGATLALEHCLRKHRPGLVSLTLQSPLIKTADWQRDANRLLRALPARARKIIRYCHEIGATDSQVYKDAMLIFYARHVLRNKTELRKNPPKNDNGNKIYQYMWGPSEFQATGTLRNLDRAKDLHKLRIPTLFVCGEHDEATPRTQRKYLAQV